MRTNTFSRFSTMLLLVAFLLFPIASRSQTLSSGFQSPPQEAMPRAYWWWLNSHVDKAGITRDLEEMKAKGYGGAILFDAGNSSNNLVKKPSAGPIFGSKEWTELFVHTLKEADRLGLEISANIQSGWNLGGPTVKPKDAMRRIFWKDTIIDGNQTFNSLIPIPVNAKDWQDVAVMAYPVKNTVPERFRLTSIETSTGVESPLAYKAFDSDSTTFWESAAKPAPDAPQHLQFELYQPEKLTSLTITSVQGYAPQELDLMISDGVWSPNSLKKFILPANGGTVVLDIPSRNYKIIRLVFNSSHNEKIRISNIACNNNSTYRFGLYFWEYKSLTRQFGTRGGAEPLFLLRQEYPENPNDVSGMSTETVNLSPNMDATGRLTWNVPDGKWRILRYGHGLHGAHVSTGSDGWSGLSLDHLSDSAFLQYLQDVMVPLLDAAKPYIGKSLKYLYTDSWEMGTPNWTRDFTAQFRTRRGYDPLPYLAVLTGEIIDNRDVSNRFLFDLRQTVADLIAERHYSVFAQYAKQHGMDIHPESGGPHGAPVDALKNLGLGAFPQGEFWARSFTHRVTDDQRLFVKQFASAAHIYGKKWVAAEGPTSIGPHWERPPRELRNVFNDVYLEGLNRLIWHTFTLSPPEAGIPGNEYFAGTHLNPNTTWWPMAGSFLKYISRCNYMLSRGLFVADVCFYIGSDIPNFTRRRATIDGLGEGFDYDYCNTDVLLTRMSVKNDLITLPDGMQYKILVLPTDTRAISVEALKKIEQLVKDGATVVGARPETSTGLNNYKASEAEVKTLASRIWGNADGTHIFENTYGKGKVVWGKALKDVLASNGVSVDFEYKASTPDARISYIHRAAGDTDIYFVANRLYQYGINDTKYKYLTDLPNRYEQVDCRFRVTGKIPELFNPVTGESYEISTYSISNGYTTVPVRLTPDGSMFVVFRKPIKGTNNKSQLVSVEVGNRSIFPVSTYQPGYWDDMKIYSDQGITYLETFSKLPITVINAANQKSTFQPSVDDAITLDGAWEVSFAKGWGAPEKTIFPKLISWTESDSIGIKYFSGIATYRKSVDVPKKILGNHKIYLDLGNVLEIAEVNVNGKKCGTAWIAPFRVDITSAIKAGTNQIEISVANMWPNRIIGDLNLPAEKRLTKTNVIKFKATDPLRPSGLLGPVVIKAAQVIPMK